jgi:hypothetical protein
MCDSLGLKRKDELISVVKFVDKYVEKVDDDMENR